MSEITNSSYFRLRIRLGLVDETTNAVFRDRSEVMITWYEKDEFLRTAKTLSEPLPVIERWHFLETAKKLIAIAPTPEHPNESVVEELRAEVKVLSTMLREMESELAFSEDLKR